MVITRLASTGLSRMLYACLAACALPLQVAVAQEYEVAQPDDDAIPVSVAKEPEGVLFPAEEHEYHYSNYIAGFVGYTSEERGEGGLTLAGEYTHRLSKHTGFGVIVERLQGDIDSWVVLAATGYRTEKWKFYGGIGFDDPDDRERELLLRVGTTYVIPRDKRTEWLISGAVDFVDGETVVLFGGALGYGF